MGAPKGNKNASKGKPWTEAINRYVKQTSLETGRDVMNELAGRLVESALTGDLGALKEFGDRQEGKPHQSIDADINSAVTLVISADDAGVL